MFSIIGGDGNTYGPVTVETIKRWLQEGRATLDTQAQRQGETGFRSLREFAEFGGAAAAEPPPLPPAPVAPSPLDGTAREIATDLMARSGPLEVMGALERGWALYKSAFWPILGVTLLVMVVLGALSYVPVVGPLFTGVVMGGLYVYLLRHLRGQGAELSDAFSGFSKALVPLIMTTIWMHVWLFLAVLPGLVLAGSGYLLHHPGLLIAGAVIAILPLIYLSIAFSFAFALVIDRGFAPTKALEVSRIILTKYWFHYFGLTLLCGLLSLLGLIALIVGVLFVVPLTFAAAICAYEQMCNPPERG